MEHPGYRIYMRLGDIELGADGVDPDKALELFDKMRAPAPPLGEVIVGRVEFTKPMLEAGAAVMKALRLDPNFGRGLTDADMARKVFEAMQREAG